MTELEGGDTERNKKLCSQGQKNNRASEEKATAKILRDKDKGRERSQGPQVADTWSTHVAADPSLVPPHQTWCYLFINVSMYKFIV